MIAGNQPTRLNSVQIHLLKMFSRPIKENDLLEIKSLLSNYYAKKVDEESDKIWEEKEMNQDKIQELLNSHIRTPYK
jgi:hypothetical protein